MVSFAFCEVGCFQDLSLACLVGLCRAVAIREVFCQAQALICLLCVAAFSVKIDFFQGLSLACLVGLIFVKWGFSVELPNSLFCAAVFL